MSATTEQLTETKSRLKGHPGDAGHRPVDVGLGLPGRLLGGAWVGPHQAVAVERHSEAGPVGQIDEAVLWQRLVGEEATWLGLGLGLGLGG